MIRARVAVSELRNVASTLSRTISIVVSGFHS